MKAAAVSGQGRRSSMEDAHYLDEEFWQKGWIYGGIYDGHGGSFAADYAAHYLHIRFLGGILTGIEPEEAFRRAYLSVSQELSTQNSGSTAVDFLIRENEIVAANAGDARAIIIGKDSVVQLTTDHRVDNPQEKERVERAGGEIVYPYVYQGTAGMMPTRTLGDPLFKTVGVVAEPATRTYRLTGDEIMLVAACDGLWDFITNEEVAGFARRISEPVELAEELKNEVLDSRAGSDNITIICVKLG